MNWNGHTDRTAWSSEQSIDRMAREHVLSRRVIAIEIGDGNVANGVERELNESVGSVVTGNQASFTRVVIESLPNAQEEDNNCNFIEDVDAHCLAWGIANDRDTESGWEDAENVEDDDSSEVTVKEAVKAVAVAGDAGHWKTCACSNAVWNVADDRTELFSELNWHLCDVCILPL